MPNSRHSSLKLVRPSPAFQRFSHSSTNLMRSLVGSVELHGMTPTTRFVAVPLSDSRTLSGITLELSEISPTCTPRRRRGQFDSPAGITRRLPNQDDCA